MEDVINRIYKNIMKNLNLSDDMEYIVNKYIKNTINNILIYCNRCDIPKQLEMIIVEMVEDIINVSTSSSSATSSSNTTNEIESIKRGDTTITYNNNISTTEANISFITDYESQLVYFKKMRLPQ